MYSSKGTKPLFSISQLSNPNFPNQTIYTKCLTSMLKIIKMSSYPYLKWRDPKG